MRTWTSPAATRRTAVRAISWEFRLENDVMQFKLALDLEYSGCAGLRDLRRDGQRRTLESWCRLSRRRFAAGATPTFSVRRYYGGALFAGTPQNPVLDATRSVERIGLGVGDVAIRTKVGVHQTARTNIAFLADARFPRATLTIFSARASSRRAVWRSCRQDLGPCPLTETLDTPYRGGGNRTTPCSQRPGSTTSSLLTRDARGGPRERATGWSLEAAPSRARSIRRAVQANGQSDVDSRHRR